MFGVDALRYFVMREMTLGQDANFSDEAILTRFNADLANDLGNVVSRTTTMIAALLRRGGAGVAGAAATSSMRALDARRSSRRSRRRAAAFRNSSSASRCRRSGMLIGARQPVHRQARAVGAGEEAGAAALLDTTLYHSADALRVIAALIDPVMPEAAERIRRMLGRRRQEQWTDLTRRARCAPGTRLGAIEPLFPRIEKTVEELRSMTTEFNTPIARHRQPAERRTRSRRNRPHPGATQAGGAGATPADDNRISIDDFMKVELRVAKVLEAEARAEVEEADEAEGRCRHRAADDCRRHRRGVSARAARRPHRSRSSFNLKPAKLMGIESNGMVLAASVEGGMPMLVAFERESPPGAPVVR